MHHFQTPRSPVRPISMRRGKVAFPCGQFSSTLELSTLWTVVFSAAVSSPGVTPDKPPPIASYTFNITICVSNHIQQVESIDDQACSVGSFSTLFCSFHVPNSVN